MSLVLIDISYARFMRILERWMYVLQNMFLCGRIDVK